MAINLIAFAGFYAAARHTVRYADTLTQALHGRLVLLHVKRASLFDPFVLMAPRYQQEELSREADTAAALARLAEELPTRPSVEVATDLLPAVAQDLADRHGPALFVLSQPGMGTVEGPGVAADAAELLRAGHFPLLVVPATAPADHAPRRILLAADRELFTLAPDALALRQLLVLPGATLTIAHVSSAGADDDAGCGAALHAVQASGLLAGLAAPELRGYAHDDHTEGLLAAVQDTGADFIVVLARQRSYLGEMFHRSVTARLLERSPVPVLVLPVAAEEDAPDTPSQRTTDAANWVTGALAGLSPAN